MNIKVIVCYHIIDLIFGTIAFDINLMHKRKLYEMWNVEVASYCCVLQSVLFISSFCSKRFVATKSLDGLYIAHSWMQLCKFQVRTLTFVRWLNTSECTVGIIALLWLLCQKFSSKSNVTESVLSKLTLWQFSFKRDNLSNLSHSKGQLHKHHWKVTSKECKQML